MGFYGDRVLPRVIDKVCGAKSPGRVGCRQNFCCVGREFRCYVRQCSRQRRRHLEHSVPSFAGSRDDQFDTAMPSVSAVKRRGAPSS